MVASANTRLRLEAAHLTALFGTHRAVRDVSLLFPAHTVTAIIGPSGCGKSTLLRCLNRMHELTPGASVTGEVLLQMLERRLDNVLYRANFALSRSQGRQLVRHGHVAVNGRTVDIPSFLVKPGDLVEVREKSRKLAVILTTLEARKGQSAPEWLDVSPTAFSAKVLNIPTRDSIPVPINEQLIVELYSK